MVCVGESGRRGAHRNKEGNVTAAEGPAELCVTPFPVQPLCGSAWAPLPPAAHCLNEAFLGSNAFAQRGVEPPSVLQGECYFP